jgi:hypothetical protein
VPGIFNGDTVTEISTPFGPGFNFQSPGPNQGAECPWDLNLACSLGKWAYPADFLGKTYDWSSYIRFPSAGNPQGFPQNWLSNTFWEVGHTNVSSGHHVGVDASGWACFPSSPCWRSGLALEESTNTWDFMPIYTPLKMDTWYKWRMQIKWSLGNDGFVKVWLNDVLVHELLNHHTAPNSTPPAMQVGIYSIDDRPIQNQIGDLRYIRTS